jgi:hypothetical protein
MLKSVNTTENTFYLYKDSLLTTCFGLNRPLSSDDNNTFENTSTMRYGHIGTKFTYVVCKHNYKETEG